MKLINYFIIVINLFLLTYFAQIFFNNFIINYYNFENYNLSGILYLMYFLIALLINPILLLTNFIFIFFRKKLKSYFSIIKNIIIFIVGTLLSISNIIFTIITISTLDET